MVALSSRLMQSQSTLPPRCDCQQSSLADGELGHCRKAEQSRNYTSEKIGVFCCQLFWRGPSLARLRNKLPFVLAYDTRYWRHLGLGILGAAGVAQEFWHVNPLGRWWLMGG